MNFNDLARHRFSARSYLSKPVEKGKLDYILEAARVAPTAVNKQPFVIFVLKDGLLREEVNNTYHRDWHKDAPILLIICSDHQKSWKHSKTGKDFADVDTAIVIDHMTLAAADIGLSTCWICNFDVVKCTEVLGIENHIEPIALLPVGYSEEKPDIRRHVKVRKSISDLVINK